MRIRIHSPAPKHCPRHACLKNGAEPPKSGGSAQSAALIARISTETTAKYSYPGGSGGPAGAWLCRRICCCRGDCAPPHCPGPGRRRLNSHRSCCQHVGGPLLSPPLHGGCLHERAQDNCKQPVFRNKEHRYRYRSDVDLDTHCVKVLGSGFLRRQRAK